MIKAKIEHLLTEAFKPAFLQVVDESHKQPDMQGLLRVGIIRSPLCPGLLKARNRSKATA